MDKTSLFGTFLGLFSIVGGHIFEGGHIEQIMQPTAFLIVVGGTFGAGLVQYTPAEFIRGMKDIKKVFIYRDPPIQSIIDNKYRTIFSRR